MKKLYGHHAIPSLKKMGVPTKYEGLTRSHFKDKATWEIVQANRRELNEIIKQAEQEAR